jgi:hypothetical protein
VSPRGERWKQLFVPDNVREKLPAEHDVSVEQAREAFQSRETPHFQRLSDRGLRVYTMYGYTYEGLRLFVVVEEDSPVRVSLLSAYDPTKLGDEDA